MAFAIPNHGSADAQPSPIVAACLDAGIDSECLRAFRIERLPDRPDESRAIQMVDGQVWREENVRCAGTGAFKELKDAPRVEDFPLVGEPVPKSFVGGAHGQFKPVRLKVRLRGWIRHSFLFRV